MCKAWRKLRHGSPSWLRPRSCGVSRCSWMSGRRPFTCETYRARWEQMHDGQQGPDGGERIRMRPMAFLCHLLMQDELENYSFKSIFRCDAINTEKHFPSLLLLVCQSADQKKPDIHFFNCETVKVSNNNTAESLPVFPARYGVWIVSPLQVLQVMALVLTGWADLWWHRTSGFGFLQKPNKEAWSPQVQWLSWYKIWFKQILSAPLSCLNRGKCPPVFVCVYLGSHWKRPVDCQILMAQIIHCESDPSAVELFEFASFTAIVAYFSTESKQPPSTCLSGSERDSEDNVNSWESDSLYRFLHNLRGRDRDSKAIVTKAAGEGKREKWKLEGTVSVCTRGLNGLPASSKTFPVKDVRGADTCGKTDRRMDSDSVTPKLVSTLRYLYIA